MAKSVWEGHLRLSLVTCPVALYKATDTKGGVSFHLINPKTNSRIMQVTKDASTGQELDRKTLVRGFEVSRNQYVLVDPDELKALRIESTHVLELERFVDAASIDRIYWDEPYYFAPSDKTGVEAFSVLLEAMRRSLDGQDTGSKERAERFLDLKKGKDGTKPRPKRRRGLYSARHGCRGYQRQGRFIAAAKTRQWDREASIRVLAQAPTLIPQSTERT